MNTQALVSIVIPAYNASYFLGEALESVLAQHYENWEAIVIDDGSKDDTAAVCKEYTDRDKRIKYFYQENAGQGAARNAGMEKASGEYLLFLDADDYLSADFISELYTALTKADADVAECGYVLLGPLRDIFKYCDGGEVVYESSEEIRKNRSKLHHTVWGRLYRRSILNGLTMNDKRIGEDCDFSAEVLKHCSKLIKIGKPLYAYRCYHESITRGGEENEAGESFLKRLRRPISRFSGKLKTKRKYHYPL